MKRFTLLFTVMVLFSSLSWAQFMTMGTKKHTQTGTVSEVSPYGNGFIYISNDGTNDVVSFSVDGTTFTDIENLETGTAKGLSGWTDSDMAFYLGNNTTDGVGVEIRKFDGTTAGYFFNHNPLNDPNQGLVTGVGRYYNGSSYEYHYLYQTGVDNFQAPQIVPTFTDGTDSYELSASEFGAQGPSINTGMMFNTTFNGNFYYAAQKVSMLGSVAGLYTLNSGTGSMDLVYESDDPWSSIYGLTPTSQNLYFYKGNYGDQDVAAIFSMDASNNTTKITSDGGSDINFDDAHELQVLNDKVYAVVLYDFIDNQQILKLAEINGTSVRYFHLNAERESDYITDIVVSGSYVYVLAAKTGGTTELYAINPSLDEPRYVASFDPSHNFGSTFKMLTAINGGVAFAGNNGTSDVVYISDGNDGNTYSLMTGGATLSVSEMISADGKLYFFSNSGADTEIWEHVVAPFPTKSVTVTVVEAGTDAAIENAQVTFNTGLETYMGTTDANGEIVLDNVPFGYLDVMIGAPSGYADLNKEQYIGAWSPNPTYELSVASDFGILVHDNTVMQPMDPTVQNATIELVDVNDATIVYSADVTDQGLGSYYASFTGVAYGTYNATVYAEGYVVETVEFIVNETTATSSNILYVAPIQYSSFGILVHDNTVMQPMDPTVQNASIELVDVNDATIVYTADVTEQELGDYFASFAAVPHGTYNATVYAEGYVVETVEFIVNETTATSSNILYVAPIQYSSFGILVHDNTVMQPMDPTVQNATIELVDVNDATIVYTADVTEQELGDYFASFADVPHGTYNATVYAEGYVVETVEFIVDETTATSSNILYVDPIPTITFAMKLYDNSQTGEVYIPSGTIELMNVADANVTYTATVQDLGMGMYMAIFENVTYGEYNGMAEASGFQTKSFTLEVTSATGNPTPIVYMDPIPTGIGDAALNGVTIYPNPASDVINIASANEVVSVEIYSINGACVKRIASGNLMQVTVSDLSKGMYLVVTTDINGIKSWTKVNKL